jgi:ribosomal-protein-alanine N-acetyltransferase
MRQLIQQPDAATWIADNGERMCGFAIVEWTRDKVGKVAYIQTLEVVAEQRGQGVGRELLRRIEDSASAAGALMIWLHVDAENAAAIRVYQANGFIAQGREEEYYGGDRAALIYAKSLHGAPTVAGDSSG